MNNEKQTSDNQQGHAPLAGVTCCGFAVGDKVKEPNGLIGEVWKVTDTSVHVRIKNEGQFGVNHNDYFYSKYLTNPWHHSQKSVSDLSHCR